MKESTRKWIESHGEPVTWVNLRTREGEGWQVDNATLLAALGLRPGHKLPEEGLSPKWIGNVRVRIRPRDPNRSRKEHRTVAECPNCHSWVCAGHLMQHMEVHDRQWEKLEEQEWPAGGPR